MSRYYILLALVTPCLLTGCGQTTATPQGNVAIVDLDEVANQLGLGEQWATTLSTTQTNVNQQLEGYQKKLTEQLQLKQSEIAAATGNELPEQQKIELVNYQQELNQRLQLAQNKAKEHISEERSKILLNYRKQAEKVSAQIARHRGYDVVLTKNSSVVLTYTPAADITSEVVSQLRSSLGTQAKAQPIPQPQQ